MLAVLVPQENQTTAVAPTEERCGRQLRSALEAEAPQ